MVQASDLLPDGKRMPVSRWHLVLVFVAFILIGANTGGLGVLIPSIRAYYRIDASTLSWIFVLSVLGYLTCAGYLGYLFKKNEQNAYD